MCDNVENRTALIHRKEVAMGQQGFLPVRDTIGYFLKENDVKSALKLVESFPESQRYVEEELMRVKCIENGWPEQAHEVGTLIGKDLTIDELKYILHVNVARGHEANIRKTKELIAAATN